MLSNHRHYWRILLLAWLLLCSGTSRANQLHMAYDADPVSLDPYEILSGGTLQMAHLLFDPLLRWNLDHQLESRLATSWQRLSDRAVRFNLRPGVLFHSGREMTALDIKWTLQRAKTSTDFKALFAPFNNARVVDKYTVDLITERPYPLLLNMATYLFVMDSQFYSGFDSRQKAKDAIEKHGNSFASTHVSGTGPFVVSKRQQGVSLELQRYANYWDQASPGNVDAIRLTPIKDSSTRTAALLAGDLDLIAPVPPIDHYRIAKQAGLKLYTRSGARLITLQLNQQKRPELRDQRVRQAIVYAINNRAIVGKLMRGFATPAGQQSPPGYAGHVAELEPRFDLQKARRLMAEAGYESGFAVSMIAPNNRYVNDAKIARAVTSMLAKINIQVDLVTMPKAQYWQQFDQRPADIMMLGWHSDTEDSANFTEFLAMCRDDDSGFGRYNGGGYCNPEVDRLIMASATETNAQRRAMLLQQVERILYQDAAFVPLHWQNLAWAVRHGVNIEAVMTDSNVPYLGDLVIQ
ncbi:MAG: ABC transporter substrate-binding protein [Gammaproteobacteria bacterium]|nr:ABC transporter substrate-binding protein [Gammaproteobacteria bacterium]